MKQFPNLGGLGRADMVEVDPKTAVSHAWFNTCPGSGGDDGPITDPGLAPPPDGGSGGEILG